MNTWCWRGRRGSGGDGGELGKNTILARGRKGHKEKRGGKSMPRRGDMTQGKGGEKKLNNE